MKKYSQIENELDRTYWERNQLVALLSKIFPAYLAKHDENDKEWDRDWMDIVVIEIPNVKKLVSGDQHNHIPERYWFKTEMKQLSWHLHKDDLASFSHLPLNEDYKWDGHSTDEKYQRISKYNPDGMD